MTICLTGDVQVRRPLTGAAHAVLCGRDPEGRPTELVLGGTSVATLPRELRAVRVDVTDGRVHLCDAQNSYEIVVASVHVHRDLSSVMRKAIPPRAVPLLRRIFWLAVLALARSVAGRALLVRLRSAGAR